ncbi:TIGR03571 family LLM class oxidoreductase [Rhizobium leguminosarum]|uniref:TIGR03571 family LLM class oxidoreductase n=1 Tax=Rhizobium leguminosarum TaxID=384 RepID=UPI00143F2548|nr:TIGR03571 family LLM class oxidoreductase [Rhizobium leguminosarum]NKL21800.1 TIGR03571 family LLM class oxidoreductase [Rhizobium leguminosarum bv. viciae]
MIFRKDRLTLGLVLPAQSRIEADFDFETQIAFAARADKAGLTALWVRDVPINSSGYPDPIGHSDPWVLLGALAATTTTIQLATGAIVLPLRHPLHIAKSALSVQALSRGRLTLGLGSGDRPTEYEVFGEDIEQRKTLYRNNWARVAAVLGEARALVNACGEPRHDFEIRPRPATAVPMLSVGSSSQSLEWIARHSIGWMTYYRSLDVQGDRIALWQAAIGKTTAAFRGFGQSMALELTEDARLRPEPINLGMKTGRYGLIDAIQAMKQMGVHHLALNISTAKRPPIDVIEEIASEVIPVL